MDHPEGAGSQRADRVDFDPRVRLELRGTQLSSDGGLLVMRELDDVLGLSDLASAALCDNRIGRNTVHRLDGLFRQSVYGRLAGYEDVNDADQLALDPVMRLVVGGRAVDAQAASATQMGRFETETLSMPENRGALADLNGQWIDRFHDRNGLKFIHHLPVGRGGRHRPDGARHPRSHPPTSGASVMRVTAIRTRQNESGSTGLSAALKNEAVAPAMAMARRLPRRTPSFPTITGTTLGEKS